MSVDSLFLTKAHSKFSFLIDMNEILLESYKNIMLVYFEFQIKF